jgi:hypothetical protein
MAMQNMTAIGNIDFDHLDFAEACALVDCLAAALDAMAANWAGDSMHMDRLALLHARALRRRHAAFDELERQHKEAAA